MGTLSAHHDQAAARSDDHSDGICCEWAGLPKCDGSCTRPASSPPGVPSPPKPSAAQGQDNTPFAVAPLIAVDAMGYCWRVFPGEFWSMCPVNSDNSPIPRPLTFYMPTTLDEAQIQLLLNYEKLEGGEQGGE